MDKTLSLVLIDQIFSFMIPLGFKTYEMQIEKTQMELLTTIMINEEQGSPYYLPVVQAGLGNIAICKEGWTLIFNEKK